MDNKTHESISNPKNASLTLTIEADNQLAVNEWLLVFNQTKEQLLQSAKQKRDAECFLEAINPFSKIKS